MNKCPDIGALRAYADGEVSNREDALIREHLAACASCRDALAGLQAVAEFASGRLVQLAPGAGEQPRLQAAAVMRAAYDGSSWHVAVVRKVRKMSTFLSTGKGKAAFAGVAAVLLLAVALSFQPVRSAAEGLLSVFRVEKFQPISIDPNERLNSMIDLTKLGTMEMNQMQMQSTPLKSVDEAKALDGAWVKSPGYLPASVTGAPEVQMMSGGNAKFTFDSAKAKAYLAQIGETNFTVPDKFNGAGFSVNINPVLSIMYGGPQGGVSSLEKSGGTAIENAGPTMVIMESKSPTIETFGGVSLDELRGFLLSVPGLPPSLVTQLKAIDDWSTTMPVPIPMGKEVADNVTVNGQQGLMVYDDTVKMGGVIWQANGQIYFVGGNFSKAEIMKVANSLQ